MTDSELKALVAGIIPVIRDYVDVRLRQLRAEIEAEAEKESAEAVRYLNARALEVFSRVEP